MTSPQIVWLRRDLRLADQAALFAAAQAGPVVPVYVLDDEAAGDHAYGGASRWWLHHSLASLSEALGAKGSRLILRRGHSAAVLARVAEEVGAASVHAIRHYEPWWRKAQGKLKERLDLCLHDGNYLLPPGTVRTGSGQPFKIFTPFSKAVFAEMPPHDPLPAPEVLEAPAQWPASDVLEEWALLPTRPDWTGGLREFWPVGEAAAQERLSEWAEDVGAYSEHRNLPSIDGSSRLSPHLHFGEISPSQVWHGVVHGRGRGQGKGQWSYARELIWRDYATNVIAENPAYPRMSYRDGFADVWRDDAAVEHDLARWQRGQTGYPIVDAGMRQLWQTGWMHNRVRMIAASFLVKHLLIDWRRGEQWFWDTLVDADYANNGVNWQWVAGTGVDSNMFVRIMAPLLQSEKVDAAGYIREYVPELAALSDDEIHDPPDDMCDTYPARMIGHREARERALAAYRAAKD